MDTMLENDEEAMNSIERLIYIILWTVGIGCVIALLDAAGVTLADLIAFFGLLPDFVIALCGSVAVLGVIIALWGKR